MQDNKVDDTKVAPGSFEAFIVSLASQRQTASIASAWKELARAGIHLESAGARFPVDAELGTGDTILSGTVEQGFPGLKDTLLGALNRANKGDVIVVVNPRNLCAMHLAAVKRAEPLQISLLFTTEEIGDAWIAASADLAAAISKTGCPVLGSVFSAKSRATLRA